MGDANENWSLSGGLTPFRFGNSNHVFGLYNQHSDVIVDSFIKMKDKYYKSASKDLQSRFDRMQSELRSYTGQDKMTDWHLSAFSSLLAERMLVGDGYNKVLSILNLLLVVIIFLTYIKDLNYFTLLLH